jgi:hypothetical protein
MFFHDKRLQYYTKPPVAWHQQITQVTDSITINFDWDVREINILCTLLVFDLSLIDWEAQSDRL